VGNAKAKLYTSSILKKINSTKRILKKKIWRNIVAKQKPCEGNTVAIYNIFFKKTTKLNPQRAQYEKKNPKRTILGKKIIKRKKKNHIGKHCSN
jgi:hypothetical protein